MKKTTGIIAATLALLLALVLADPMALAQRPDLHPTFPFLDRDGRNVLETGNPVSTMQTCGGCHDTAYIASHSSHADMGLSELAAAGQVAGGQAWDTGAGLFGQWNPLLYRYLTPPGDAVFDMGIADWVRTFGFLHVGGGPAETAPDGTPLAQVSVQPGAPAGTATHILDPESGDPVPWDWEASGTVEMNCFLCHIPSPNNAARVEALQAGQFEWANTATLLGTGIVTRTQVPGGNGAFVWNPAAFTPDGELAQVYVTMQDPDDGNCGQCHGEVHVTNATPLVYTRCDWNTAQTGEIFSSQRLFKTGMNLQDKQDLTRAWDVHAGRAVECVDCHPSVNNPVYFQGSQDRQLPHLIFDARRMDVVNYLYRPSHEFAAGSASEFDGAMRRCEGCHAPSKAHDWLPYQESHFDALRCESCHIPQMYAPALQQVDWTVIHLDGAFQKVCRGVKGDPADVGSLITGFRPVLLPEEQAGDSRYILTPFNLISTWYWVYGDPERPVRQLDLQAAYLDGDHYRADILAVFDSNGDGALDDTELRLDTQAKEARVKQNLIVLGLDQPRIAAQVQPHRISHDVVNGGWAVKDCQACHGQDSLLSEPFPIANYVPGSVLPEFYDVANVNITGRITSASDGRLFYEPDVAAQEIYVFGHSSVGWIDGLGVLAFLGTIAGVAVHGGLRFRASRTLPPPAHSYRRVYMYTAYERLWHWIQAAAIFMLVFTGLIIHKPDVFGLFSFPYVVQVHNIMGFLLLTDAFLALFYHLTSGKVRQFIPQPRGFFGQMITQALFYLRGIFKGEAHPFAKRPEQKLNPLQQITYVALLNVLLPLQIITGTLMWGAQRWPELAARLGGLPALAPAHSLIAWLFASFIVLHIYLSTTGHSVLGNIQAMVDGWEMVEVHHSSDQSLTEGEIR
jgi:thiosulfate reductase cytochrome b subunit